MNGVRSRCRLAALTLCLAMCLTGWSAPSLAAAPEPRGEWPLEPVPQVVTGFSPPAQPWQPGHRGVDLLGRVGQPVVAAMPGEITYAASLAGRGVVVVAHADGTRTTYEPVSPLLDVGTTVSAGARIGVLQVHGSHCFPTSCLHWGWRRGEEYLDPLSLVGVRPVRLLPLWSDLPPPSQHTDASVPRPTPTAAPTAPRLLRLLRILGGQP
ncbi:M23 family metallopeptidase [Nocardioides limicola]|uniref:M23 family metallopeptidase n=1 Tax=Nocardioides limicola TaxID=2803368 RepID=UPI001EF0DE11|nr:peptidoglycan DD-metalloendopeptidase family protein [Nocardioides sp. DJM-14]